MPFQLVPPNWGDACAYVLRSDTDGRFYMGATSDLRVPFQRITPAGRKRVHDSNLGDAGGRPEVTQVGTARARVAAHEQGRVRSTAYRRPLRLVYYEACLSPDDAYRRERYLKSGRGGRYLRQRLISWLPESRGDKCRPNYFFLKRRCAPGKRHLNRSEQSGRQGKLGRYKLERY